jgi:DNA-binding NtrC family response regulator
MHAAAGDDRETELDRPTYPLRAAIGDGLVLFIRRGSLLEALPLPPRGQVVVGRDQAADVHVEDSRVSRRHARLVREGDRVTVEDLGSRNGTWVAGTLVRGGTAPLALGDVVKVGALEISPSRAMYGAPARDHGDGAPETIVVDAAMLEVMEAARILAHSCAAVLVVGETGSGKDVVIAEIHRRGPRADKPLVRVNCTALSDADAEVQLATGGGATAPGSLVERARGGTLVLDHVGDLSAPAQARVLRLLEEAGGEGGRDLDIRFLATSQRDLRDDARAGRFREDLLFRLEAVHVAVPPLRQRPVEISLFAQHFARAAAGRPVDLTRDAHVQLLRYDWPGNVRELRNVIEQAVLLACDGTVQLDRLPEAVRNAGGVERASAVVRRRPRTAGMQAEMDAIERRHLTEALAAHHGNRTRTASSLGISRRALLYKLAKHSIQ